MNKESRSSWSWLLIIIGVWYFLFNLGLIPITPWPALIKYWPVLLIWHSSKHLIQGFSKKRNAFPNSVLNLFFWFCLALIGVYLLLPRLGFNVVSISWNLIWPIIIIFIGLINIFKERDFVKKFNQRNRSEYVRVYKSFFGDFSRGGNGWSAEDTSLEFAVGSAKFDYTKAIMPEKTILLEISGLVGDVMIYLPDDLPLRADCSTSLGDIKILHEHKSGAGNMVSLESPDYSTATKRIDIQIQLKVGNVSIRKIG